MSLQARVMRSYPKRDKNGILRKMFICAVTGTEKELEQYVALQSKRLPDVKWKDEDDNVFYWTSSPSGQVINLEITIKGNVVEDTTMMDVKAASNARYDYTYETVKAGLSGAGGSAARVNQPVVEKEETTPASTNPLED